MAIKIFVDSGADLPPSMAQELDITIVPLSVHFGDSVYKDGVELTPEEFYRLMVTSPELPNTSQPSPGDFLKVYTEKTEPGDTVFSFHLSSKLSGTYQSALLAARQLADRDVRVIDTRSASLGIGNTALLAAMWAAEGISAEQIHRRCQLVVQTQSVLFLVDSLEYLQRHGRIGKAQAFVGGLLKIKPVLGLGDGVVIPIEKVRGQAKAISRVAELAKEKMVASTGYVVGIVDAQAPDVAEQLEKQLGELPAGSRVVRTSIGSTIGTHTGPGTAGIVVTPIVT